MKRWVGLCSAGLGMLFLLEATPASANSCLDARIHYEEYKSLKFSLEYIDLTESLTLFKHCRNRAPQEQFLFAEALYEARRPEAAEELARLFEAPLTPHLKARAHLLRARMLNRQSLARIPEAALREAEEAERQAMAIGDLELAYEAVVTQANLRLKENDSEGVRDSYELLRRVVEDNRPEAERANAVKADAYLELQNLQELGLTEGVLPACAGAGQRSVELACLEQAWALAQRAENPVVERKVSKRYTSRVLDLAIPGTEEAFRYGLEYWKERFLSLQQLAQNGRRSPHPESLRRIEDDLVVASLTLGKAALFAPPAVSGMVKGVFGLRDDLDAVQKVQAWLNTGKAPTQSTEFSRQVLLAMSYVQEAELQTADLPRSQALRLARERLEGLPSPDSPLIQDSLSWASVKIDPVDLTLLELSRGSYYFLLARSADRTCTDCLPRAAQAYQIALDFFNKEKIGDYLKSKRWLAALESQARERLQSMIASGATAR